MATATATAGTKALGTGMTTALVIGNMIGSGVFLLPASLAAYGGASIVGWLVTTAGALLLALVFHRLSRVMPKIGGPYAYSHAAFGDFVGFLIAWGYWIAVWAGNAAIVVAFVGYLGEFWPGLTDNAMLSAIVGVAVIWLLTLINIAGVRPSGWVQLLTTIGKLVPLLGIALIGLLFFNAANFTPFNPSGESNFGAVTSVMALTLWAFIGLESATVPAEDVEDPSRTIPRATIVGTIATAAVYILGTVAVMSVVPREILGNSTAPFADAARAMLGDWAAYLVAIGALISTFGCLNGWILLQGQIPLAAARDGLALPVFARVSANGTPTIALVVSSILITLLMLANYHARLVDTFNFFLLLATLTTLIPYAATALAALVLYARKDAPFGGELAVGASLVAVLAFVYSIWTIYGAGTDAILWGLALLAAGAAAYAVLIALQPAHGNRGV
jgi:APA family basic amino acid/polyamine antiporter